MDITAESNHMELEQEDYRKRNWAKPLLEMYTEWHTEGSRNNGRMASRTDSPITGPEAYQMTTEKAKDIQQKLPVDMATPESPKKSTTK